MAARLLLQDPKRQQLLADVAVADALALPVRPGSFDAVLCIAVLHHLSSAERRRRLLRQLLAALRTGGRALVTVWATQQANMRKVRRWEWLGDLGAAAGGGAEAAAGAGTAAAAGGGAEEEAARGAAPLAEPSEPPKRSEQPAGTAAAAAGAEAGMQQEAAAAAPGVVAAATTTSQGASSGGGAEQSQEEDSVASGDYFVPWHLPFHRAEVAAAAAAARGASGSAATTTSSGGTAGSSTPARSAVPGATSVPRLDPGTGAVVFRRYYHLFEGGELEGLVAALPGAAVVDSFYDKDNWCVVFERRGDDAACRPP